ncbi:MAG: hypothetical protein E7623_02895 [Ruminococcaceae bacterium]|nr:hypothetical protein [Oscillospiraceae bacterium]
MQRSILDKEILAKWLGDIISEETKKSDTEIDWDLVDECEAFLAELYSDVVISDEQMAANIAKIKTKTCTVISPSKRHRTPHMRRLLAACLAAVILLCSAVTAYALVPSFRHIVRYVLNLDVGECVEDGDLTYIHGGTMQRYSSVKELIKTEELDFLPPIIESDLLKLETILCADVSNTIVLSFSDTSINYEIWINNTEIAPYAEMATESYRYGVYTTYVVQMPNSGMSGYCSYTLIDNDIHTIVANSLETIELLISSIS